MASNGCGCGPSSVSIPITQTTEVKTYSTHCLASEYRLDYGGQATGDLDPVIATTPDKILWTPLPDNSTYGGASCLNDKANDVYTPICSVQDWLQWFEKYISGSYCRQTTEACQWSYATRGAETISKGLVSCLGLSESSPMIVWDEGSGQAIAGNIGYDSIKCEVINRLLQDCVEPAPAGEVPDFVLGHDAASGYDIQEDTGTYNGTYRFPYKQVPQYVMYGFIPSGTGNNSHRPASLGNRYFLHNVNFSRLQPSPTLINQFNTANGRLYSSQAATDGVWVTLDMTIFCSVGYTATSSSSNSINLNLGIAVYDANGSATAEYRLDSDRLIFASGNTQTVGLHGTFTYFLSDAGMSLEPRIWYGGSYQGAVDLQVGSAQSNISIHTEEMASYKAVLAA